MAFRGESTATIFDAILNRAPVGPVRLNPNLSSEFERIINKALEKDRNLRYQSAAEMRSDLLRLKRDTESARLPAATEAAKGQFKISWNPRGGSGHTRTSQSLMQSSESLMKGDAE